MVHCEPRSGIGPVGVHRAGGHRDLSDLDQQRLGRHWQVGHHPVDLGHGRRVLGRAQPLVILHQVEPALVDRRAQPVRDPLADGRRWSGGPWPEGCQGGGAAGGVGSVIHGD
jgi:hypothetical protein